MARPDNLPDHDPSLDALDRLRRLLDPALARISHDDRLLELLTRTQKICEVDVASLLLVDDATGDLVVSASVGLEDDAASALRLSQGEGLAGRVLTCEAVVVVESAAELADISPVLTARGILAAAAAPMCVDNTIIGVLVVGDRAERVFDATALTAVEIAAERLALAVEHHRIARLDRERESRVQEATAGYRSLHELAAALAGAITIDDVVDVAVQHGVRSVGARAGTIALLERDSLVVAGTRGFPPELIERWSRFPVSALVPMAEAARTCTAVVTRSPEDLAERFPSVEDFNQVGDRSSVSVPLIAAGNVLGSVGLMFADEHARSDDGIELIEAVAHQCAQALARAQLYEAERDATARLRFLARASGLLLSSLDYETTLRTLAESAVPAIADWCAVDMVTRDGGVRRLAVAHVDPAKVALAHELDALHPFDPQAPVGLAAVLRTGVLEHLPSIPDDHLVALAPSAEWLATVRSLGLRSAVTVPLNARGRTLGAITLVMAESGREYGADEVEAIEELARLAGVAIDNAQLFNDRTEVARALQASLLPPVLPRIPRLELAARYLPSGLHAEVGGDFYDVFRDVGGQWAFVIGDVCGKGPEAAAVTGLARHSLRAVAQHDPAPGVVLEAVNTALLDQVPVGRFCTIGYARVNVDASDVTVTVASGGHPLALVRRPSGLVEAVGRPGMLVGVTTPAICPEDVAVLGPGDALLLYTDGLVERHQAAGGVEDGEPALRAVFSRCDGLDADAIADLVLSVAFDQPEDARDDVAILVVRVAQAQPDIEPVELAADPAE